ncbi:hypothetical protein TpMuguga_04g02685 [Theileria parva strain Muguga]|uniref:uncharacterized protein n=1 Tax=Theileria parva strain Muguga TaxID=333668 RepID=UPI001C61CA87|nr:uncharacterized protein TpMuguga_04g02685 [Theileria parva strain Muguga]KAF5153259.1 hypothetical protein TpMuguga_04g02685 [Theileria parva strain Muguga]
MCTASPNKLERLSHEYFVSSLRTWCNSQNDQTKTLNLVKSEWVNRITNKLTSTSKVDLMKLMTLTGLYEVELDFIKLSVPTLIYFSTLYNSGYGCEDSCLLLTEWSNNTNTDVSLQLNSGEFVYNPIYINRERFKNLLLKMLNSPSRDKRIRRIQIYLSNPDSFDHTNMDLLLSTCEEHSPSSISQLSNSTKDSKLVPKSPKSTPNPNPNSSVLTPNSSKILELLDQSKLPKLFIEYIEPTKGLFKL